MANTYNYYEAVKADVENWIEDNLDIPYMIECGEFADFDDISNYLNDCLWTEDSVTGNASGSYTFNGEEAKGYVLADIDTIREALEEFGTDAGTIADKFLAEDWEYFDVTARCYLLGQAIEAVLEDNEAEIEALFEEHEAATE